MTPETISQETADVHCNGALPLGNIQQLSLLQEPVKARILLQKGNTDVICEKIRGAVCSVTEARCHYVRPTLEENVAAYDAAAKNQLDWGFVYGAPRP